MGTRGGGVLAVGLGTRNGVPHFAHLVVLPACLSSTSYDLPQVEHWNRIIRVG
jgi:hypothetical protein